MFIQTKYELINVNDIREVKLEKSSGGYIIVATRISNPDTITHLTFFGDSNDIENLVLQRFRERVDRGESFDINEILHD